MSPTPQQTSLKTDGAARRFQDPWNGVLFSRASRVASERRRRVSAVTSGVVIEETRIYTGVVKDCWETGIFWGAHVKASFFTVIYWF